MCSGNDLWKQSSGLYTEAVPNALRMLHFNSQEYEPASKQAGWVQEARKNDGENIQE